MLQIYRGYDVSINIRCSKASFGSKIRARSVHIKEVISNFKQLNVVLSPIHSILIVAIRYINNHIDLSFKKKKKVIT